MSNVSYNLKNFNAYNSVPFMAKKEQAGLDIVTKPIDKVENIVNSTVDTFVPEAQTEEKKNTRKTAIRVGSTVLVLSAIVAILNPKFSSKLVNNLKTKSAKAGNRAKVDNSIIGLWNKCKSIFLNGTSNSIQAINNFNSMKDELFQKLCSKTSLTNKVHKGITKGFDKISKQTVFNKYKSATKQMNTLENILKEYQGRLSASDKFKFEQKIGELKVLQEKHLAPDKIKSRLSNQEDLMQNLEGEVSSKIKQTASAVWDTVRLRKPENGMKIEDTFKFWAEEAIMPQRNKLVQDGSKVINSIVGDGKSKKGLYQEMIEILEPKLNEQEKIALEESVKHTGKLLRKANTTECVEYFDKKRDLVLGSAPTDILTAVASLIASGIAIGVADTKEDRISRFISGALPVFAGFGVSTALAALLFSGGKGMAIGAASSMALSAMGSTVSHKLFPKNKNEINIADNKIDATTEGEVKNA